MADLSTGEQYALATGIVLTAVLLVVAFYAMRHLRRRREHLREKREDDPAVASDRAFNRLAMARTEADLLERQGVDVARARQLIGLAESSFGTRQFDRAFDLAQSAHNTLVAARKAPKTAPPAQPPAPAAPSPAPRAVPAHGLAARRRCERRGSTGTHGVEGSQEPGRIALRARTPRTRPRNGEAGAAEAERHEEGGGDPRRGSGCLRPRRLH